MLVANGLPSERIQPVVDAPTCVAALMLVVAADVDIQAFQTDPPRKPFWAVSAHRASAGARVVPIVPGVIPSSVTNTRFLLGRKCATALRAADKLSVHMAPWPAQSPSHAPKSDPLAAAAVIFTLVPGT